ncbi:MAG: HEAT repeat domain-containing protein [Planctomycetes bacterium]|nr:HEAT repeat domain-containing protein [Planctomycetota bacterium]
MRIAAFGATLMIAFAACSTTTPEKTDSPFTQPNKLMAAEISRRIDQIPYQHREELVESLLWLVQTGEQVIPAVLTALHSEQPKVRSSAAWVLGMLRDRRTIPYLQQAAGDSEPAVRLECARTLVLLGDLTSAPMLIEGLDSERKEVRYLCHEALRSSTGHDFGYDHLAMNKDEMRGSVLRWREWWSGYSGDASFAMDYQQANGIGMPAAPQGETQIQPQPESDAGQDQGPDPASTKPTPAGENQVPQQIEVPTVAPEGTTAPVRQPSGYEQQSGVPSGGAARSNATEHPVETDVPAAEMKIEQGASTAVEETPSIEVVPVAPVPVETPIQAPVKSSADPAHPGGQ